MDQYIAFAQQNMVLVGAWVALLVAVLVSFVKSATAKYKNVPPSQAAVLVNRENATIIDVRAADEYRKGHIAGSVHIPLSQIEGKQFSALEKYKGAPIIVVCASGMRSVSAAQQLVKAGFSPIYNISGGIGEWQSQNLPLVKK